MLNIYFPLFYGVFSKKKKYKLENNLEWMNTFVNLVNLCLDQFEWKNLPESCNARFLEQALLFEGKCALAKDPELGYLTLRCNPSSILNIYGEYSQLDLYSVSGYQRRFKNYLVGGDNTDADAVLCRDNDCFYPYYLYILLGSERLANSMRSIDQASFQLKRPYFITCEETQKTSVEGVLNDLESNKPAIITTKGLNPDSFQVLQTGANPAVLQQMWDNFYKHDNQVRTMLGIQNNAQPDKAERLLVDEINSNNQLIRMNIEMRLKCRKQFCEQVNELFGLNIDVELRYKEDEYYGTNDISRVEETIQSVE